MPCNPQLGTGGLPGAAEFATKRSLPCTNQVSIRAFRRKFGGVCTVAQSASVIEVDALSTVLDLRKIAAVAIAK